MRRVLIVVFLMTALLASGLSAPALAESESDGGYFDFFSDGGKIGNRFVSWIWAPHYFPGGIDYTLFLLCFREDQNGNRVGTNKVTVKNIAFLGVDSNLLVEVKKQSQKISKYHNNGYRTVDLPALGALANDNFVIAEVQFQIKGNADRDQIKCSADVTESPQAAAAGEVKVKPASELSLVDAMRARPTE